MDVIDFLSTAKRLVKSNNLVVVPRDKNKRTLWMLGISLVDIEETILDLTMEDFVLGPVEDRDYPGENLYIFKTERFDELLYIKLKLENNQLKCLSFHIDNI